MCSLVWIVLVFVNLHLWEHLVLSSEILPLITHSRPISELMSWLAGWLGGPCRQIASQEPVRVARLLGNSLPLAVGVVREVMVKLVQNQFRMCLLRSGFQSKRTRSYQLSAKCMSINRNRLSDHSCF